MFVNSKHYLYHYGTLDLLLPPIVVDFNYSSVLNCRQERGGWGGGGGAGEEGGSNCIF